MIDGIGAEHVECAFIMIGGTDGAFTVQVDIVLRGGVHQQSHGGVGRCVDQQVQIDVGVCGSAGCLLVAVLTLCSRLLPVYKLLTGDGVGCRCVIHEHGILLGCHVAVDHDVVAVPVDTHIARGIYRPIEVRVAEVGKVEGQQVVGLDVEVEAQVGQVLVVDAA